MFTANLLPKSAVSCVQVPQIVQCSAYHCRYAMLGKMKLCLQDKFYSLTSLKQVCGLDLVMMNYQSMDFSHTGMYLQALNPSAKSEFKSPGNQSARSWSNGHTSISMLPTLPPSSLAQQARVLQKAPHLGHKSFTSPSKCLSLVVLEFHDLS